MVTDDTIRSLTISQRALGTRSVVLIHHTGCGLQSLTEDFRSELELEVGQRPTWAVESFVDVDQDVRQSMQRVRTSPFLLHTDDVRGFVFDVHTGLLREITALRTAGLVTQEPGTQARMLRAAPASPACSESGTGRSTATRAGPTVAWSPAPGSPRAARHGPRRAG